MPVTPVTPVKQKTGLHDLRRMTFDVYWSHSRAVLGHATPVMRHPACLYRFYSDRHNRYALPDPTLVISGTG
eukprot:8400-Heterococcus_DN1.PRE.2